MRTHNYIALFLCFLVSVKTLLVPVVYLDFELRKEYIVQNLCQNRFRPELHCDGRCYLAKTFDKIAEEKATQQAEKQGQGIKKVLEEVFDFIGFELPDFENFSSKYTPIFSLPSLSLSDFITSLLRPPAFM
ncbi:MAG: hypothetical protein ACK4GN_13965 [Runella sp.]